MADTRQNVDEAIRTIQDWVQHDPQPDPPPHPPQPQPPAHDTGNTSSGSSSSSSSSSSTPTDPRIAQLESLFRSAYIQLWGEPPTEAYLKQAAHSGMNVTEFVERERSKEAFKKTKTYQDEFKGLLTAARQAGVF